MFGCRRRRAVVVRVDSRVHPLLIVDVVQVCSTTNQGIVVGIVVVVVGNRRRLGRRSRIALRLGRITGDVGALFKDLRGGKAIHPV
jgi:hypothetical protein